MSVSRGAPKLWILLLLKTIEKRATLKEDAQKTACLLLMVWIGDLVVPISPLQESGVQPPNQSKPPTSQDT